MERRRLIQAMALAPILARCSSKTPAVLAQQSRHALGNDAKFLIVVGAAGGASIIDSFLAVRASECTNASILNTFPDGQVHAIADSPFRAVEHSASSLGSIPLNFAADQRAFVNKHKQDMLVATTRGTSVNHAIAQKRSINGNAAWNGRTLQECVARQFGMAAPVPNVNMATTGFQERGTDDTLPASAFAETVANPTLWPLGLDSAQGLQDVPAASQIAIARNMREALDNESVFTRTFAKSKRLELWRNQRAQAQTLEASELAKNLNVLDGFAPTADYGIASSPDSAKVRAAFPLYAVDSLEGQAALAFLLIKYGVSVTVSLSPTFNALTVGASVINPPLAFDYCHNDHRATQAYMWKRILGVCDRLIDLLKAEPFGTTGQNLWDRSLLYVATDFGRTRDRPPDDVVFSTGHDMNNGVLIMSPMVKGNTVLGGVDPQTTLTYGFDPATGAPDTGKDESNEPDIFSGILTAMGVDTTGSGLPDASAFKR